MDSELHVVAGRLEGAQRPEEVFGDLRGTQAEQAAALKTVYHKLAKVTHPDAQPSPADQALAQAAFTRLTEWYTSAQSRIQAGVYGSSNPLDDWRVVLPAKQRTYVLENTVRTGPIYTNFLGTCEENRRRFPVLVKITRQPHDNDLAENEAQALQALSAGRAADKFGKYLPTLLDSFYYDGGSSIHQVNVFEREPGWVPLTEVRQSFPNGLDPKEVSWIWRRVLVGLGFAHLNGRIHGALLPGNIEILPEQHGLRLVEWSYSVPLHGSPIGDPVGEPIPAIDPAYEGWYPDEVRFGEAPLPGTDIHMAALCMIDLLGGDPVGKTLPPCIPKPLRLFFQGCTLPGKRSRPQDAWALKNEFEELIRSLWGELKFHPFIMQSIHR